MTHVNSGGDGPQLVYQANERYLKDEYPHLYPGLFCLSCSRHYPPDRPSRMDRHGFLPDKI